MPRELLKMKITKVPCTVMSFFFVKIAGKYVSTRVSVSLELVINYCEYRLHFVYPDSQLQIIRGLLVQ